MKLLSIGSIAAFVEMCNATNLQMMDRVEPVTSYAKSCDLIDDDINDLNVLGTNDLETQDK